MLQNASYLDLLHLGFGHALKRSTAVRTSTPVVAIMWMLTLIFSICFLVVMLTPDTVLIAAALEFQRLITGYI